VFREDNQSNSKTLLKLTNCKLKLKEWQ